MIFSPSDFKKMFRVKLIFFQEFVYFSVVWLPMSLKCNNQCAYMFSLSFFLSHVHCVHVCVWMHIIFFKINNIFWVQEVLKLIAYNHLRYFPVRDSLYFPTGALVTVEFTVLCVVRAQFLWFVLVFVLLVFAF